MPRGKVGYMKSMYTEVNEELYRDIKDNGTCLTSAGIEYDGSIFTADIYRYGTRVYAIAERLADENTIEVAFCNRLA